MELVKVKLEFTISKRWIKKFIEFLNCLRWCGDVGASRVVAFYSDGDGDFVIKDMKLNGIDITKDINFSEVDRKPVLDEDGNLNKYRTERKIDFFFDAG